jgi:hypothetical protein
MLPVSERRKGVQRKNCSQYRSAMYTCKVTNNSLFVVLMFSYLLISTNVLDNSDSEYTDSCNVETNEDNTIKFQQADGALAG